jgi:hypothetical protein
MAVAPDSSLMKFLNVVIIIGTFQIKNSSRDTIGGQFLLKSKNEEKKYDLLYWNKW